MKARMRDPADMPKLTERDAALAMNGVDDAGPYRCLFVRVEPGCLRIALALPGYLSGLRDDETAVACALTIVPRVQSVR